MEEIDKSLYTPAGFSMRAYRGETEDQYQMLAFAICTPGYLLSVYLVGNDKETEQLLCRGLRRTVRTEAYTAAAAAAHPVQRPAAKAAAVSAPVPPLPGTASHSEGGKPGNGPAWL